MLRTRFPPNDVVTVFGLLDLVGAVAIGDNSASVSDIRGSSKMLSWLFAVMPKKTSRRKLQTWLYAGPLTSSQEQRIVPFERHSPRIGIIRDSTI
jgi:hypothetical protein